MSLDVWCCFLVAVRENIHEKHLISRTLHLPAFPSPAPSLHPLASISMQTQWRTCWISVVYSGPGYSGNLAYSTRAAMSKIWAAWAETSTKPSSWITLLPPTSSTLIMLWVLICFWSLWSINIDTYHSKESLGTRGKNCKRLTCFFFIKAWILFSPQNLERIFTRPQSWWGGGLVMWD